MLDCESGYPLSSYPRSGWWLVAERVRDPRAGVDQHLCELGLAAARHAGGRAGDTDGGGHAAVVIVDRRADRVQMLLKLLVGGRVAARQGGAQLGPQGGGVGDATRAAGVQPGPQQRVERV